MYGVPSYGSVEYAGENKLSSGGGLSISVSESTTVTDTTQESVITAIVPVLVQGTSGNGGNYVNSYTIAYPSSVTAGDFLTLFLASGATNTVSISDNKGNTWVTGPSETQPSQRQIQQFYVPSAIAGSTTVTITFGAGQYADSAVFIQEWSGIVAVNPYDTQAISTSIGTTQVVGPYQSTTQDYELVFMAIATDSNAPSFTGDPSYSTLQTQAGYDAFTSGSIQYKFLSRVDSPSATLTSPSSRNSAQILSTFFLKMPYGWLSVLDSTSVFDSVQVTISSVISSLVFSTTDLTTVSSSATLSIISPPNETITVLETSIVSDSAILSIGSVSALTILESESTAVSDTVLVKVPYEQFALSDSTAISDSATLSISSIPGLSFSETDSTAVSDTIFEEIPYAQFISNDSTSISDSTVLSVSTSIFVNDTSVTSDTASLSLTSFINVSDSSALSDSTVLTIISSPPTTLSAQDSTTVTDSISISIPNVAFSVNESTTVSDNAVLNIGTNILVTDSTPVSDLVNVSLTSYILVSEVTAVSDIPTLQRISSPPVYISVNETTAISDTAILAIPILSLTVSENTPVSEVVALSFNSTINVSDSSAVSDSVILVITSISPVSISALETTAVSDIPQLSLTSYLSVEDSTVVSDIPTLILIGGTLYIDITETTPVSSSTLLEILGAGILTLGNFTIQTYPNFATIQSYVVSSTVRLGTKSTNYVVQL
jgi:epidermal growth factor receptor substrate 15